MKNKIALLATAAVIASMIIVGGTLAFFTDKGEAKNVITIGDVKITLTEPKFEALTSGRLEVDNIKPADRITKDPTITNTGSNDAYIRCKVNVSGFTVDNQDTLATRRVQVLKGLNINPKDWVACSDGYLYYQRQLPTAAHGDNRVTLFDTFEVPKGWGNETVNQKFQISISAEAIQADHFTPARDSGGNIVGWNYSSGAPVKVETVSSSNSSVALD